jgi:hypothetical protein
MKPITGIAACCARASARAPATVLAAFGRVNESADKLGLLK